MPRARRTACSVSTAAAAQFQVIRAKAVILCCGAAGRLGLPASGYLMGTYENPTNAGDGYAMAYHAGAELANLECFQINPLIKDYNGPACAYVTGPLGGYTANGQGRALHRVRLLERPDDVGVPPGTRRRQRPGVPQARPPGRGNHPDHRGHPPQQRTPQPRPVPRRARHRLPPADGGDAHLRDRFLQRPLGLGRVGQREGRDQREGPLRGRRHGRRAAQLHARRLHLRLVRRAQRRRIRRRARLQRGRQRPGRARACADRGAAAARARPAAGAGGVQAAPHGQRLPAAAQGDPQDGDRPAALRGHRRGSGADQGGQPPRADARPGSQRDPRLRRDGRARLAVPHREPLGPVPPSRRLSPSATTPTGSATRT